MEKEEDEKTVGNDFLSLRVRVRFVLPLEYSTVFLFQTKLKD